ncbi:Protein hob3 [Wickerhamiella sorbophila]|uniref:Protein hob3 n=1 Tax=Wickerhamiella sorbophila TaxID=45607 RepID=A0A2T0FJ56_9ASCO|nr:Protein hob3 [Wickerhamiella sorbophila]PRT55006.1 Protein hob3 [Wickerhamiella sorbophila]
MSWNGFKKAVSRAGTSVMMKAGQIEQTVDREYEMQERRFRTMERATNNLQKEAKGYLDSLRAMTSAQVKIAEVIDVFYGDSGASDDVSTRYLTAVRELDSETVKELDEPYRECVLEPITRFTSYFVDVNEAIKKRSHKLMDYDKLRAKTKKLIDKPSDDSGKLPLAEREENQAREIYTHLNDQLTAELPQLIDFRVPYLDPSFEALVKIQLRFCQEAYTRLAEVQQYLEPQVRDDYASGQLDTDVEAALVKMRELTIAGLAKA